MSATEGGNDSTGNKVAKPGSAADAALHDVDRDTFEYLMEQDVAMLLDNICARVMTAKPRDLIMGITEYLLALKGGYSGGVLVAGESTTGGWIRGFDHYGTLLFELDKLTSFQADNGITLIAPLPRERSFYVALADGSAASEVRKYGISGELKLTIRIPKVIHGIAVDRSNGKLWACYKAGGGSAFNVNGTKAADYSFPPAQALVVKDNVLWLLTSKAIEKRDTETGMLIFVIHLPDSITRIASLVVGERTIWAGAHNLDGSPNYVGGFETTSGRTLSSFVSHSGSMLAYDIARGGVWLAAHHGVTTLTFHNEKGNKIVQTEVTKARQVSMTVDRATGMLWLFRVEDESRLGLLDPLRNVIKTDIILPDLSCSQVHMVPL